MAVPNCLDFDEILENMEKKQINGLKLLSLKKIDLLHIGFNIYSHRTMIYQYIKSLITKNKIPNDNDNNNDNDEDGDNTPRHYEEGREQTETADDIPEKYKCSLTNKLMSEPVICGHNNKVFEKSAIYKYINEHNGELPTDSISSSVDQINIDDSSSFLLFDDLSLKIEIEQFKQENNL